MSVIRPFRAVRPNKEYAALVPALPYDVMNSQEAREKVKNAPYSFIHVDKAEVDLPEDTDIYSSAVYEKAAENLKRLEQEGICFQEETPKLYIYRQQMGSTIQTGLVGCASVDDYLNGVIKRHELTRADKEEDRVRHVDTCDANTGPIFLAYRRQAEIDRIIDIYTATEPEYSFVSEGYVRNTVWVISNEEHLKALTEAFNGVESLYIADGHHRAASAVRVAKMRREAHPDYTGSEEFNFFLAVYFRADELKILDYNRVLKVGTGMEDPQFFGTLARNFDVIRANGSYAPESRHSFGMIYGKKWYILTLKPDIADESDAVKSLDVSLLQDLVIAPIFGITDPRTDKRIDFVGGIRGLEELEKRCNEDCEVAFSMYPTSLDELMSIADKGMIMPPKSTWFEPKLLSGIFVHKLK